MRHGQAIFASFLVGLVLLLNALAASPNLHAFIHNDADSPEHNCAITIFAHGQVDSAVVEVTAILPVAPVEFLPQTSVSSFNALVESLPPGRGPPVFLLHS